MDQQIPEKMRFEIDAVTHAMGVDLVWHDMAQNEIDELTNTLQNLLARHSARVLQQTLQISQCVQARY